MWSNFAAQIHTDDSSDFSTFFDLFLFGTHLPESVVMATGVGEEI